MSDDVLDNYISILLMTNIEESEFGQYIDLFSKFLGYVNPDYKYNGSYLRQYIADFIQVYQALKNKNEKYNQIFMELLGIGQKFELSIDSVFYAKYISIDNVEKRYIQVDKSKITSAFLEVRVTIEYNEDEYLFCKEYPNLENELSKRVYKDVKAFMKMKKIRRISNGTA